jgi:hypothetical protein
MAPEMASKRFFRLKPGKSINYNPLMKLQNHLSKLLSHVYKRQLDPHRAARIYREFDVDRGYEHYHRICQSRFARTERLLSSGPLQEQGFEYLTILSTAQAQDLLESVISTHHLSYVKKDTKNLQGFHLSDNTLIRKILSAVLTRAVDTRLVGYFKSEYFVHWLTFTMTPQAQEQESVSFRWHCDRGPKTHLKLIVYLNATDAHGGNTEFVPLADTASVAAHGYLFGQAQTRSSDIHEISQIAQRHLVPCSKSMRAGDGVIFQPATVLHRGVSPRLGPRYIITLCLLPSPVHWETALARGAMSDLATDTKWHQNAVQLLNVIEDGQSHQSCPLA